MGSVWVVVVAAGSGSRFGRPKQFEPLGDRRVVDWSLAAARTVADGIVLVVPAGRAGRSGAGEPGAAAHAPGVGGHEPGADAGELGAGGYEPGVGGHEPGADELGADAVVAGGATRSASVRAGLAAVPDDADVVLVHDAARPLAGAALFAAVVEAVRAGADAVVPAVAVTDTLRRRTGGLVARDDLVAVQTPQGFRASSLRAAHVGEPEATDDASLVEAAGGKVVLVDGWPGNLKITHALDLTVAGALLAAGATP